MRDSVYEAQAGEVQTKLDAARDDGGGVVRLSSGDTYDPTETWHIWDDVTLDYSGAEVRLTSDIDLHRFYPTGRVVDQDVDLRNVGGYSSAVNWALNDEDIPGIVVYSEFDNQEVRPWEKFPDGKPLTNIDGGRIVGSWENGTGILLENRIPQGLHFFDANLAMKQIGTGVHFQRHENAFQINGNLFDLHLDTFSVGIRQEYNPGYNTSLDYLDRTIDLDKPLMNGNQFNLSTQTGIAFENRETDWLWKIEEGKKNQLTQRPFNFDIGDYSDSNGDGKPDGWLIEDDLQQNTSNVMLDTRSLPSSFLIDQTSGSGTTNGIVSWTDLAAGGIGGNSTIIGEVERVSRSQSDSSQWHTISLDDTYETPIVVMQPLSHNGSQPAHVRLRSLQSNSFEFQFEEWDYLDGSHADETVTYTAMESGQHTLSDGTAIEAGTVRTDDSFASVRFSQNFGTTPVVLAQAQTRNGPDAIATRQRGASPNGVDLTVQESEANGSHAGERIGYIAIEPGSGSFGGIGFRAGTTGDTVTDDWYRVEFGENYGGAPGFLASMQTYDGLNPAGLRYRRLSGTNVDVMVEEETSSDDETRHASENVGYLVTNDFGLIYA